MRSISIALALAAVLAVGACSKPLVTARVTKDVNYFSQDYAATPNDAYYAVRWALKECGIPVESEDLPGGRITTKWIPVTAGSHYTEVFGRPDYGVTGSYHQLDVRIAPEGGRTLVRVGSRAKTIAHNFKSTGEVEREVLVRVGDYLRGQEPSITNLGIQE